MGINQTESTGGAWRKWLGELPSLIKGMVKDELKQERALAMDSAWWQAWDLLDDMDREDGGYRWPMDIFVDDNSSLFLVYTNEGQLYRAPITVINDEVMLGDSIRVTQAFPALPENRTKIRVHRMENGRNRFVMIAATAMLNRVGEIDSTVLFDNFVERATNSGEWPIVDFWHFNGIQVAQVVENGLFREGYCYMCVFEFDDTPVGRVAEAGFMADMDYWGASIEFNPIERELITSDEGISIPVFTDGINTFITLLPQEAAASWYTAPISRKAIMNEAQFDDLVKLLGGNEELAQQAVEDADATNRAIDDSGAVARSAEVETEETETEEENSTEDVDSENVGNSYELNVYELDVDDPELLTQLAQNIVSSEAFTAAIAEAVEPVTQALERQNQIIARSAQLLNQATARLEDLERSADEVIAEQLGAMPSSTRVVRLTRKQKDSDVTSHSATDPNQIMPGELEAQANDVVANMAAVFSS